MAKFPRDHRALDAKLNRPAGPHGASRRPRPTRATWWDLVEDEEPDDGWCRLCGAERTGPCDRRPCDGVR